MIPLTIYLTVMAIIGFALAIREADRAEYYKRSWRSAINQPVHFYPGTAEEKLKGKPPGTYDVGQVVYFNQTKTGI